MSGRERPNDGGPRQSPRDAGIRADVIRVVIIQKIVMSNRGVDGNVDRNECQSNPERSVPAGWLCESRYRLFFLLTILHFKAPGLGGSDLRLRSLALAQTVVYAEERQFQAVGDSDFIEDVAEMMFDGPLADCKLLRDLPIRITFDDRTNDFPFARCQVKRFGRRFAHGLGHLQSLNEA